MQIDESIRTIQTEKLRKLKAERDQNAVDAALKNLRTAAMETAESDAFYLDGSGSICHPW